MLQGETGTAAQSAMPAAMQWALWRAESGMNASATPPPVTLHGAQEAPDRYLLCTFSCNKCSEPLYFANRRSTSPESSFAGLCRL